MGFFQDLKEDLSIAVDELAADPAAEGNKADAAMSDEEVVRQLEEMTQAGIEAAGGSDAGAAAKEAEAAVENAQTEQTEDTSDMMPSEELAKALEAAGVVEQDDAKDAISPDGKAAPVFGEQMELNLSEAAQAPVKADVPNRDTIEAVASELESIASIVNKETVSDVTELEEKPISTPEEMLKDQPQAVESTAVPTVMDEVTAENLGSEAVDENAVITKCMTVKGDILSKGSVEIIGCVEGNVTALGKLNVSGILKGDANAAEVFADAAQISGQIKADGTAKIGKDSVIIGNIYATSAVIAGAVKGDIDVHGPVILDSSAIVMGNIRSKSVQINNGAAIEGLCSQCYADNTPSSFFDKFSK